MVAGWRGALNQVTNACIGQLYHGRDNGCWFVQIRPPIGPGQGAKTLLH